MCTDEQETVTLVVLCWRNSVYKIVAEREKFSVVSVEASVALLCFSKMILLFLRTIQVSWCKRQFFAGFKATVP